MCCFGDWVSFSSFRYCKVHKCKFSSLKCPKDTPSFPVEVSNCKSDMSFDFTSNSQAITSNSQGVHILNTSKNLHKKRRYVRKVKDSIFERYHNHGVKFDAVVQWDHLFKYDEVRLNNNVSYKRIDLPLAIVKVFKKSILVTLRSCEDIKGLDVESASIIAQNKIVESISKLPQAIEVKDFDVVSRHNAFVNDPLAKSFSSINVCIAGEQRIISDKSKGRDELEFVSKEWCVNDSREYEKDLTALIDKGLSRDFLASALNDLIKDRYFHAENMRSHVEAIRSLSDGVKELREQIRRDSVRKLREDWW